MHRLLVGLITWTLSLSSVYALEKIKGFNLTEIDSYTYDAATSEGQKTSAQKIVDKLFTLGVRQINLNPRAIMKDPRGVEVIPMTTVGAARNEERNRYLRLIKYIKGKGMKVGIRPIFFVVDQQGHTPFEELMPDGSKKIWWHGNIQPQDPDKWFESFRSFLDIYLAIAKYGQIDEFTLGAELYSMTVGIEDQWERHPHGFPSQWLKLLQHARKALPPGCKIMYDINFTDATIRVDDTERHGGELARWKYRLVDLADANSPYWRNLKDFWVGLDSIGIDMYRSLASKQQSIPASYADLVNLLQTTSDRYASQIDTSLFEIAMAVGVEKPVSLKELGFRSVTNSFINPFEYASHREGSYNSSHQAAAYAAIFKSFYEADWSWFQGAIFWDASVNPALHGEGDTGFSPLGKSQTESILLQH